jgi:hypothetical protein
MGLGFVLGLSRVTATRDKEGLDGTSSIDKGFTGPRNVSPDLPPYITVITAAEATIARTAIVSLVTTEVFPVAAFAIVPAPVAADAPVETAVLTAID